MLNVSPDRRTTANSAFGSLREETAEKVEALVVQYRKPFWFVSPFLT
jgi:hypothetical protein